ncbi:MAG TPA: hypothetical protein VLA16_20075 [Ideonella sp.]|nr:hypothetical protein [Ideonella sp.]
MDLKPLRSGVPTGKWELTVRHPQLPKGRKYFTFDTEEEAVRYGEQWDLLVKSGIPIPQELLEPPTRNTPLGSVLRGFANSGQPSRTDQVLIARLIAEVGDVPLTDLTYRWVEQWVERLKTGRNLAPSSIRQRVGALARAIDYHQRGKGSDVAMLGNYGCCLSAMPPTTTVIARWCRPQARKRRKTRCASAGWPQVSTGGSWQRCAATSAPR